MEETYEKLEELIKDDDKIVTVPSFAWETNTPENEAREIIEKFIAVHDEEEQIQVTYVLVGTKKGEHGTSVVLVRKKDLHDVAKLFEDGVQKVVFSIQKAKSVDWNVLALAEPSAELCSDPIKGSVIGKNCIKRVLKKKLLAPLPTGTIKGKGSIFAKQPNKEIKSEEKVEVKKETTSNENNKNKTNQQGSISNMFGKATENKKSEEKDEKPLKKLTTNSSQPKKNSIMNMFGKIPPNKVKEPKKEIENEEKQPIKSETKSDIFDSDTEEEIMKDLEMIEEQPVNKKNVPNKKESNSKCSQKEVSKNNPKKRRAKNSGEGEKKRRRIIVENDSDSDIFDSDKSDIDLVEKSDEEPVVVKPVEKPPKNKKRKTVERTYQDEEGFLVTQTEYVYVSASEEESEPIKKPIEVSTKPKLEKKQSSNSENDVSPKKGAKKGKKNNLKKTPSGNQTSLMNFFKPK
ncbi:uncharacterized protein LOC115874869 isoform X1 [Sitophilus oryzae]|uniref:DNA polymerase delta subunit 3 n=1 Tax=Sitophilus oryzae TaxID=7048 RepID=A0A6J2X4D8_SITOR|nr:uncharacterized protein LOC115874869 isoform X1 [Sitophilus oryzae]